MKKEKCDCSIHLRVPCRLKRWLAKKARKSKTSLSSEIVEIIKLHVLEFGE